MSAAPSGSAPALAPWLQTQLQSLLTQRGHAWLLCGPSGLGQFALALALARAWLCDQPTPQGACGQCGSCHAVDVRTHADLCVLMPETLSLALGWPLDQKTQEELDKKTRKPSKEIKVDAARNAVAFTQFTRSRGDTKVVVVFPAERMNHITANTLLKTLEEPPGAVKFVLATEAAHQLLPTIRSRCQSHALTWPEPAMAAQWLAQELNVNALLAGTGKKASPANATASPQDLATLLQATGGRPADALAWAQSTPAAQAAEHWQHLPQAMARGDVSAVADWSPALTLDALQKICHDMLALRLGAEPRFFSAHSLALAGGVGNVATVSQASLYALTTWSRELMAAARSVEHPFNAGLMLEALVSRARQALQAS